MIFSSFTFIFYFFPAFVFLYVLTPIRYRIYINFLGSVFFYTWATPIGALLLLCSTAFDYYLALRVNALSGRYRKIAFSVGVISNLIILIYFKYSNLLFGSIKQIFFSHENVLHNSSGSLVLLIGVSFFVFTKISILVDIYRNEIAPVPSLMTYCTYILFFPKLLQGPITRFKVMQQELKNPVMTLEGATNGLMRIVIGLAKKILIADQLGLVVDTVFSLPSTNLSTEYAWLGMFAYSFQIYFDFSGYTDIALGIGRMMGYSLPENFKRPYLALNFTDFWKRWHLTLTSWFREYLYIPLGGNRKSPRRTVINLWIVFLISGFWHGANWTFVIWGIFHGTFLILDRYLWIKASKRLGTITNIIITFIFISIGWVFFRSDTIGSAFHYIATLFNPSRILDTDIPVAYVIKNRQIAAFIIAALLSFFPEYYIAYLSDYLGKKVNTLFLKCIAITAVIGLFVITVISISSNSYKSFIYLRF